MTGENQSLRGFEFDKISVFLSDEEYEKIDTLIGEKHQTLIALHAKLFITDFETASRKKEGVLCIVLNIKNESTTFRMYCLNESVLLWNKDTPDKPEDYVVLEDDFHLFRPEDSLFHFRFRNDEEGKAFENAIRNLKPINRQTDKASIRNTLQLKENYQKKALSQFSKSESDLTSLFEGDERLSKVRINDENNPKTAQSNKEKKRLFKKIKKEDIGQPWDFRHVMHVGWDEKKGLDCQGENALAAQLKELFDKAGTAARAPLRDLGKRESSGSDSTDHHATGEVVKEEINTRASSDVKLKEEINARLSSGMIIKQEMINSPTDEQAPEMIKPAARQLPKVILDINMEQNVTPDKPPREAPPRTNKVLVNYLRTKIADSEGLRKSLAAPPPPPKNALDANKIPPSFQVSDLGVETDTVNENVNNIETQLPPERASFSTLSRPKDPAFSERLSLNTLQKSRNTFVIRPAPPLPPTVAKASDSIGEKGFKKKDEIEDNTIKQVELKTEAETDKNKAEASRPVPAPRKKASS